MPRISDVIDQLGAAKYLDLRRGYWQVLVAEEDQCKNSYVFCIWVV